MNIYVESLNEVYMRVYSDDAGIEAELSEYFKFPVEGAKYTPKYRAGLWNGLIYLYSQIRKTLYVGLFDYLEEFAKKNNYKINYADEIKKQDDISFKSVQQYIESLNVHSKNKPIQLRDYQTNVVYEALVKYRMIAKSPTSSGKSAILYALIRYHLDHNRRVLLIVPRASLVAQMFTDFEDYSSANGWNVDDHIHQLYSGQSKEIAKPVTVSTWQSIYKLPKSWFDKQKWDVVIVDEAHTAAATSLTSILEKLPNTKYRLGTTGTVSNTKTNFLVLTGLFGPVYEAISTKQLMERNQVAQLKIKQLILSYPDEYKKVLSKADYQKEIDFLTANMDRNKFIVNLALATSGNTLILSQYIEKQLDILHEMLQNKAVNRKVFYIHGKVDVAEREEIRHVLEQESNAIVCASFGTMSTGVNAPSIENIIFASPSKSSIRVLQSVGRGLRLKDGKEFCTLFDIGDNLSWKSKFNHTMRHAVERYKIYCQEQFNVKIIEVDLQ